MQVIEKVKVVPEGYNGAGMNYDGCNRRDVNGKANAGLTLVLSVLHLAVWLCLVTDVLLNSLFLFI